MSPAGGIGSPRQPSPVLAVVPSRAAGQAVRVPGARYSRSMSTASTTQALPAQEPANRITAARLDRFARIVVAAVAVAVGWVAGIFVFGLVSVRYGYWRGLGLTDEEIGGRVLAREQAKAQQQGGRDAQQQ